MLIAGSDHRHPLIVVDCLVPPADAGFSSPADCFHLVRLVGFYFVLIVAGCPALFVGSGSGFDFGSGPVLGAECLVLGADLADCWVLIAGFIVGSDPVLGAECLVLGAVVRVVVVPAAAPGSIAATTIRGGGPQPASRICDPMAGAIGSGPSTIGALALRQAPDTVEKRLGCGKTLRR